MFLEGLEERREEAEGIAGSGEEEGRYESRFCYESRYQGRLGALSQLEMWLMHAALWRFKRPLKRESGRRGVAIGMQLGIYRNCLPLHSVMVLMESMRKEVGTGWNHCGMHRQSSRSSRRKKNGDKSHRPRGCGATYAHKAAHGPRNSCVELW